MSNPMKGRMVPCMPSPSQVKEGQWFEFGGDIYFKHNGGFRKLRDPEKIRECKATLAQRREQAQ